MATPSNPVRVAYAAAPFEVRGDLVDAHAASWDHVGSPGAHWSGPERVAIARVALEAFAATDPLPPWVAPSTVEGRDDPTDLPAVAVDAAYRLARHAGTLTSDWYDGLLARGLEPVAYVELVGVVVATVPVAAALRGVGGPAPEAPAAQPGEPTDEGPTTEAAELNWVPVAPPADQSPAVVQALSATPAEFANLAILHAAQYIPMAEMGEMDWDRGTLDRRQIEFVAARLSVLRECFF